MDRPTHYATKMPKKWELGTTLCNKAIGRWAEFTRHNDRVTCKTCLSRLQTPAPAGNPPAEAG